jgi:hypothetical protein
MVAHDAQVPDVPSPFSQLLARLVNQEGHRIM